MPATREAASPATPAAASLDFDAIDQLAADLGHTGVVAVAQLLGLDRTTIWRYRQNLMTPNLAVVDQIAERLGVPRATILGHATGPKPPAAPSTPKPPAGPKAA